MEEQLQKDIEWNNSKIDEAEIEILLEQIWDTYDRDGQDLIGPSEFKDFLKDLLTNVLENRKM